MFCPNCGSRNPDDASFCLACGNPFFEEEPQVQPAPRRPLWPLILVGILAGAAVGLLLYLLLLHEEPAPAVPSFSPAPAPTAAVDASTPAPAPTTEIIILTPQPATAAPITPAPATPTPIPATPAPATPTPAAGTPVKLQGDTLYRINIFLSNFSEQNVLPFSSSTVADDYLIRVVEIYCKINHRDAISYANGDECLSLETANMYLNRFFNRTVSPYNGQEYLLDAWHTFVYKDGYFRFPAADGASYNKFTVVYDMLANSDGTYTVDFQIYELDIMEYLDKGMDNALYWLSNEEAADLVWNRRILPVQGGTAVVRDYTFNGRPTYQILSYDVWDIEFSY